MATIEADYRYKFVVVVDHLSKFDYFLDLCYPLSASSVAALVIQEIVCLYRFPKSIFDRDKIFMSNFL